MNLDSSTLERFGGKKKDCKDSESSFSHMSTRATIKEINYLDFAWNISGLKIAFSIMHNRIFFQNLPMIAFQNRFAHGFFYGFLVTKRTTGDFGPPLPRSAPASPGSPSWWLPQVKPGTEGGKGLAFSKGAAWFYFEKTKKKKKKKHPCGSTITQNLMFPSEDKGKMKKHIPKTVVPRAVYFLRQSHIIHKT